MLKKFKIVKRMTEIASDNALYEKYVNEFLEEKGLDPNKVYDNERIKEDFSQWLAEKVLEEIYAE